MPRDIMIEGDGQRRRDTHLPLAVSTPSPVRKRGRPRKATSGLMPSIGTPTGASIAETPPEAAGGGQCVSDVQRSVASPHSNQIGSNAVADEADQIGCDAQRTGARPSALQTLPEMAVGGGQRSPDAHAMAASPFTGTAAAVLDAGGGGEVRARKGLTPTYRMPDLAPIITSIVLDQKKRRFCIRSQNRQDNATLAFVRMYLGWSPDLPEKDQKKILDRASSIVDKVEKGKPLPEQDQPIGDACALLILSAASARKPIDELRKSIEKSMERSAKQLPVWEWASGVKGFGAVGLAVVIGEAGADLNEFANPGKLWKRMGLAPLRGKSAKTWRLEGGLTAEDWTWYGYKPARRSEIWNRVPPLVKAQISKVLDADGEDTGARIGTWPYGQVYLDRKKYELDRDPEMSKMHAHNRAARYMEKRLLKHLWQAWRRQPITD